MQYGSRVTDTGFEEQNFVEIFFTSPDCPLLKCEEALSVHSLYYKVSDYCRIFKKFSEKKSADLLLSSSVELQIGYCCSGLQ